MAVPVAIIAVMIPYEQSKKFCIFNIKKSKRENILFYILT